MSVIFESPWLLLAISAVLLAGVSAVWQVRGRRGRWMFVLPVLAAVSAVGLDVLVQTDSEQIQSMLEVCRRAALAGDAGSIAPFIASDYRDAVHSTRAELLKAAEDVFRRAALERVVERGHKLQIEGDTAQSRVRYRVHLDPQRSVYAAGGTLLFVVLEIDYRRNSGRWQIQRVVLVSVNDTPMGWKDV
ncbi:MAG TPA: nuclear transport factor 2 family protein [Anaerohalosphaeraceae bacterium]|nr:nuclear transport factor 2 family protein [Anaerohalosphaeraceae bacterium]